jgi:DNA-binding transcriptional LysR family regulator
MASALDWDEFRLIKAIADARSLVGAAEALNLNHSTVFRRLAAIESDVGARLFERSRAGYQPTEAGEEMIALASSMAESILEFERRVAGRDAKPSGELRVTAVDSVAIGLLASRSTSSSPSRRSTCRAATPTSRSAAPTIRPSR